MSDNADGSTFFIPRSRRLTWDLMYFNRSVPLCAHDRFFDLARLAQARADSIERVSWSALFLKAYAILAQECPQLRQIWYRWPIAHLYQHPDSVGVLTVHREYRGSPWLFWGRIPRPESMTLLEIQARIDEFSTQNPGTIFRRQLRLAQLPTVLRRIIWGWNLAIRKRKRAEGLGTFFLSTLSGGGTEIQSPPSIHTGCLTFGPLGTKGTTRVTLAYDHRVVDGSYISSCLNTLEGILSETLCQELLQPGTTETSITPAA